MSFARTAGAAGAIAVIAMVVTAILQGNTPTLEDPVEEVVAYFAEDLDQHRAGLIVGLLILPFFATFLAGMVMWLRAPDEEHGEGWAIVAVIGGIFLGAGATVGDVATGALVLRGTEGLDDSTVLAVWDIATRAYGTTGIAIATLTGAVAMSAIRHPRWPAWYGWLSALVALLGVLSLVGASWTSDTATVLIVAPFAALIVWTLVSSVMLLREP